MDEYVKIIYTRITFMNTLPQASDTDISYNGENKKQTVHTPKISISTLTMLMNLK